MKKSYFLTIVAMLFCCLGMNAAAELTFSNVSLAPGTKLEALAQDQQITFNTNMDAEIGYMLGEIYDETKGEMVLSFTTVYDPLFNNTGGSHEATKDAPQTKKTPHFTFVCPSFTKLYEGHTYSLNLRAYVDKAAATGAGNVLASGSIKYEGATPAYLGSPFKLLTITPDPATHVINSADNRSVTLHFNNKVRLNMDGTFVNTGSGTSAAYESVVPGEDADSVITKDMDGKVISKYVYSSSWTLTPKMSTISDGSDVVFAADAYDKSGLHVSEGTDYSTGADESSYYTFTVANDLGRETFDITPNEGIKTLSSVVVSSSQGIAQANIKDPAVLYEVAEDGTKTAVAQVTYSADLVVKKVSGDDVATSVRLMFDKAITKAGKYVLSFPRQYFNIGSGMLAGATAARDVEYTIEKEATPYTLAFTPSDDDKITNLSEVKITFTDENEYGEPKFEVGAEDMSVLTGYVYNDHKELVTTTTFDYPIEFETNAVVAKLVTPISNPGKYTLVVPDGQINYAKAGGMMAKKRAARGGANLDEDEDELEYNALIVKDFTVEQGSLEGITVSTSIENKATVSSISNLDITFEGATTVSVKDGGMAWWKTPKNVDKTNPYYDATYAGKNVVMMSTPDQVEINGNTASIKPFNGSSKPSKAKYVIDSDCQIVFTAPAGYFIVNGVAYPEISFIFTVDTATAVEGVEAAGAAKAQKVYTLDGVKVNGSTENLKGAFIVNGKKVVLK